jgi:uncharacterized protein YbjT (DUF2867 family)
MVSNQTKGQSKMPELVAVVTGASQGIGRATALRLAKDFSALVLAARNGEALEEVAAEVKSSGRKLQTSWRSLFRPQAKWMTGSAVRMDGGEIKGV